MVRVKRARKRLRDGCISGCHFDHWWWLSQKPGRGKREWRASLNGEGEMEERERGG